MMPRRLFALLGSVLIAACGGDAATAPTIASVSGTYTLTDSIAHPTNEWRTASGGTLTLSTDHTFKWNMPASVTPAARTGTWDLEVSKVSGSDEVTVRLTPTGESAFIGLLNSPIRTGFRRELVLYKNGVITESVYAFSRQ